ncbi:MAG: apolipoprotein N-acyltransferase [Desulforhopalus sp.]
MSFLLSKNFLLALLTGVLFWVGFPGGGGLWPLVFVALVPLLFVIQNSSLKNCILCGLSCGLAHYLALLYWVVIVLGKYGGMPWFISLQGVVLLALYMSFYLIAFAVLSRIFLSGSPDWLTLWLLPALWVGIDWGRSLFLTGFPWMDVGYSLYEVPFLIQIADIGGHHAVSFMILLVNTLLFFLLVKPITLRRFVVLLPGIAFLAGVLLYSGYQYGEMKEMVRSGTEQKITVGVVQGNIKQEQKWSAELQEKTVQIYTDMTKSLLGDNPPDFTVWPETALPFYPPSSKLMGPLFDFVKDNGTNVLTGAPWYEIIDRKARTIKFYNSAVLLGADGQYHGKYYKTHLVPFGEYVPFKRFLPFLAPLVEAVGDFTPGNIENPLVQGEVRAGVLICFESVFPELSRQWINEGANLLVNLTNDAWYGKSSAPTQSLAMTVLRAVETRRSVVRSANTGISAFISPVGEIINQSDIFVPWAEKEQLTLHNEKTIWVRYGHNFAPMCLGFAAIALVMSGLLRSRSSLD